MPEDRRDSKDVNLATDPEGDRSSTAGGRYGTPGSTFNNPLNDSGSGEGEGGPDPGNDDAYLEDNFPVVGTGPNDEFHSTEPDSSGVGSPGMGGIGMGRGTDLGGTPGLTGLDTLPGSYGSGGSSEQ
jgi:hypothetical protein